MSTGADRDEVRNYVTAITGRAARWSSPQSLTLEIFNADATEQLSLIHLLQARRSEMEQKVGGPIMLLFHTRKETSRLYPEFSEEAAKIDRTKRREVIRRLAEESDPKDDGKPGSLVTSTAAQRVSRYHDYVKALRNKAEPSTLTNEELLEELYGFAVDMFRYTTWGEEHNFAIMALAGEWYADIKAEIMRRMK